MTRVKFLNGKISAKPEGLYYEWKLILKDNQERAEDNIADPVGSRKPL